MKAQLFTSFGNDVSALRGHVLASSVYLTFERLERVLPHKPVQMFWKMFSYAYSVDSQQLTHTVLLTSSHFLSEHPVRLLEYGTSGIGNFPLACSPTILCRRAWIFPYLWLTISSLVFNLCIARLKNTNKKPPLVHTVYFYILYRSICFFLLPFATCAVNFVERRI